MMILVEKLVNLKENYSKLQQYGYEDLNEEAYNAALESLSKIDDCLKSNNKIINDCVVYPTSSGGITFDWTSQEESFEDKELAICFEPVPELHFEYIQRHLKANLNIQDTIETFTELQELIDWYIF